MWTSTRNITGRMLGSGSLQHFGGPSFQCRLFLAALHRNYASLPAVKRQPDTDEPAKDIMRGKSEKGDVIIIPSHEDEESYAFLKEIACKTPLESPRLFGSYGVGKPLVGELAPIRPREHRFIPQPYVEDQAWADKVANLRPSTDLIVFLSKERDRTLRGLYFWLKDYILRRRLRDQRYDIEKIRHLGSELAAAHIFLSRGARVKFQGVDKWYSRADGNLYTVPGRFVESARVEVIDATGTDILYEAFDYFIGLRYLKSLTLRNCVDVDDFCLPRLYILSNSLEYLDLSGCPRISERGLACLYHLRNLKTLVIEDLPKAENKELTALLLEDELPLLEVLGVEYNRPSLTLSPQEQEKILEAEWTKNRIPLFHKIANPTAVEVGNIIYSALLAKEKSDRQKQNYRDFKNELNRPG